MSVKKIGKYVLALSLSLVVLALLSQNTYAYYRMLRVGLAAPSTVYSKITVSFEGAHSVSGKLGMSAALEYPAAAVYEVAKRVGRFEISRSSFANISEVQGAKYPQGLPLVTDQGLRMILPTDKGTDTTKVWADSTIEHVSFALVSESGHPKFALFDSVNLISPAKAEVFQVYHYPYRGSLSFFFESIDGVFPINTIEVEDYLYGVVPKEMPSSWNMEALKAQAVCARTYALSSLGKYSDWDYDLAPTTHSQVYGGYDAEVESTNLAVDSTRGEELFYGEDRVQCFFHASNGGYMANSQDVFVTKLPYFNAKPDPFTEMLDDEWELELNGAEITAYLNREGVNIGDFLHIDQLEINPSRRVDSLRIVGTEGSYQMDGRTFRYITDIDSLYFGLNPRPEGQASAPHTVSVLSADGLSTQVVDKLFVLGADGRAVKPEGAMVRTAGSVVGLSVGTVDRKNSLPRLQNTKGTKIYGYGNGHGLGLSQWGAKFMAEAGKSYSEILKFYYDGVTIKKQD